MTAQHIDNVEGVITALGLPGSCRVDQRVPKKLLLENGAPTAADKRLIVDVIEEIQWVAALKPNTIGVSDYRDDLREYLEIDILTVTLRVTDDKPAKSARIHELMHRAVPYPVLLLLKSGQFVTLSLAHKRWAQKEMGKVVLDGGIVSASLPDDDALLAEVMQAFMQSLALSSQRHITLFELYQNWIESIQALVAARLTGMFKTADSPEQAAVRRQALQECERLELEVNRLRTQAAKEKQLARQVELNLALKRVQAHLAAARHLL
ncbi:MAG: DUF4391 domain-containing protein [Betaproteobacteria bacterium]|nr:DUF4391 domain-containing protein [Betaproteobacteria bacterium]